MSVSPIKNFFHTMKDQYDHLTRPQRGLTVALTIFATLLTLPFLGIGGLITFKVMTGFLSETDQKAARVFAEVIPQDQSGVQEVPAEVIPQDQILTLNAEQLMANYNDESFWGAIEERGIKRLIIRTEEGEITYDTPVLRALQILKPDIKELTEKVALKFLDGELVETKAKLRLCGDLFNERFDAMYDKLFEAMSDDEITLSCSRESFLSVLEAVNLSHYFRTDFPAAYKNVSVAKYLLFPPKGILISHPHIFGQEHFEKFWGKIDPVPLPPQELLTFLDEPCPITKDGRKVIDTHKVFWIPQTVDGQPLTIDRIQEIARSDKFGENKVGYEYYWDEIQQQIGHLPIEGGCWVAVGPPLEETRGLPYAGQCEILKAKCPGYGVISAGHAIISCLVPFAASGEITLGRGQPYWTLTRCSESVNGWQVSVGGLSRSGLFVYHSYDIDNVLVVPSRKFSGKLAI